MFFNNKSSKKVEDIAKTLKKEGTGKIKSDVMGSYTGTFNKNEKPEQDADDL